MILASLVSVSPAVSLHSAYAQVMVGGGQCGVNMSCNPDTPASEPQIDTHAAACAALLTGCIYGCGTTIEAPPAAAACAVGCIGAAYLKGCHVTRPVPLEMLEIPEFGR